MAPVFKRNTKFTPKTNVNACSVFCVTVPSLIRGSRESTVFSLCPSPVAQLEGQHSSHQSVRIKCPVFLKSHWYWNYRHLAHPGICKLSSIKLSFRKCRQWLSEETIVKVDGVETEDHNSAMKNRTELAHKRTWVEVCLICIPNICINDQVISPRILQAVTLADFV